MYRNESLLFSHTKHFGNLVKQMKLPEKEAGDVADKMVKVYSEMDTPTQILVAQQSKFGKEFTSIMSGITKDFNDNGKDVTKINKDNIIKTCKIFYCKKYTL